MIERRKQAGLVLLALSFTLLQQALADPVITDIEPRQGSTFGESRITITANEPLFARTLFNFLEGDEHRGNSVNLTSDSRTFSCRIHPDGCHETQITCYPPAMPEGDYVIRVTVDGVPLEEDEHCPGHEDRCTFTSSSDHTPTIEKLEPLTGPPGTLVKFRGRIITDIFKSNNELEVDALQPKLLRVFLGGKNCELQEIGQDEPFGVSLDGESSFNGEINCKQESTYVGCMNGSFIVSDKYGRSRPGHETLRVDSTGRICMYQSYAIVESVSPSAGSTEGGTRVTITGKHFDETDAKVKVNIAGTTCKVAEEVQDTEIVCETEAEPAEVRSHFPGDRGLTLELWKETHVTLDQFGTLSTSAADYETMVIDESVFKNDTLDGMSARIRGYFVAPTTSDYTMHVLADGDAELWLSTDHDPANKEKVASASSQTTFFKDPSTQMSARRSMTKDKQYYMEVLMSDSAGGAVLEVAARAYNTKITGSMTGAATEEQQKMKFSSEVTHEKQTVTVTSASVQDAIVEKQEVSVTGSDETKFRLGLSDTYTEPLSILSTKDEVTSALNKLPTLAPDTVEITEAELPSGKEFVITFNTKRGDLPDLQKMYFSPNDTNCDIEIKEVTKGKTTMEHFTLSMDGVISPEIPANTDAVTVQTALLAMFSRRCPSHIAEPANHKYLENFENSFSGKYGYKTSDISPFCGRFSAKNPNYLYVDSGDKGLSLQQYKQLCFAYLGTVSYLNMKFTYQEEDKDVKTVWRSFHVPKPNDKETWAYACVNIYDVATQARPGYANYRLKHVRIYREGDLHVDTVAITAQETTTDLADLDVVRTPQGRVNGALVRGLTVNKDDDYMYTITIDPHDCGHEISLFSVGYQGGLQVDVVRVAAASPPIGGNYQVRFKGETTQDLLPGDSERVVREQMEQLSTIGDVEVVKSGDCANFNLVVTWKSQGGDHEDLLILGESLTGENVERSVLPIEDGSLWYNPLLGDTLRSYHTTPQVQVYINNILSRCVGDCEYNWESGSTPTITGISPDSGTLSLGTSLVISGTGFGTSDADNKVAIGGVDCAVTSSSETSVNCSVGNGPLGSHLVILVVAGKGKATSTSSFEYTWSISGIAPTSGSTAGGTLLTISGFGFGDSAVAQVDGVECPSSNIQPDMIICETPARTTSTVTSAAVTVTQGAETRNGTDFTYDSAATPTVTSVTVSDFSVAGGGTVTITGSGFGASKDPEDPLTIGGKVANITSYSDTEVVATVPSNPPGDYPVRLRKGDIGYAATSSDQVVTYTLAVNNVYPKVGSLYGGTKVTITGQGLSTEADVKFGPHECEVESATDVQIICTIEDTGVVHKVENTGSHPDYGKGYGWEPKHIKIETGDTVKFVWTTPSVFTKIAHRVVEVKNGSTDEPKPEGFSSGGDRTPNGQFKVYFADVGEHFFSSDYVDEARTIIYKGKVNVVEKASHVKPLTLTLAGHEATYSETGSSPTDTAACPAKTDGIAGCSEPALTEPDSAKIYFTFSACYSPSLSFISKTIAASEPALTVDGSGFSNTKCQNEITIGDAQGEVISASPSYLSFTIDVSNMPAVGQKDLVRVRVSNLGYSKGQFYFTLMPLVKDFEPKSGSRFGGTSMVITGSGFEADGGVVVDLEGYECVVQSVTYTQIECITSGPATGLRNVSVVVRAGQNDLNAEWKEGLSNKFNYESTMTPEVTSVTPTDVSGSSTILSVVGTMFGTSASNLEVSVAKRPCVIQGTVTDTGFSCDVGSVPVGDEHQINVIIANKGRASSTIAIKSLALISTVTPSSGSVHGHTSITIGGNGFVQNVTSVALDGEDCLVTKVTAREIVYVTPSHAVGSVDIVVTVDGRQYPTKSNGFTYSNDVTPTFTSVTPNAGKVGDEITITGSDFSTVAENNVVMIDDVEYVATSATATELKVTLNDQPTGTHPIKVVVAGLGATSSGTFTYALVLTSISPAAGGTGGDQTVTLTGSGFMQGITTATICDLTCDAVESAAPSATQFLCKTPAQEEVTNTKTCDVTVTVNDQSQTIAGQYTYNAALTPEITGVSPGRSGTGGGVDVTIAGTGFGTIVLDVTVTIGQTDCPVKSVTDTQIVCTTEESTPQETQVRVEIGGNGKAKQTSADFQYVDVWSSPFTWGNKGVPVEGDFVVVPKGQLLMVDINTPVLKMLLIQGGEVIFDEKDIELNAENILLVGGGKLTVGTETAPFQHKAIITLHGHHRSKELPTYGTKCLAVREGALNLHGKPVSKTWTNLGESADAGDMTITLKEAVEWTVGDQIVIATTGDRHSQAETEVRTITAISSDATQLTLDTALEYNHLGVTLNMGGGHSIEARAEVGLLTHNVVVRGSKNKAWDDKIEACPDGFNTGEFDTQTCFQGRFGDEMGSDQFGAQIMVHQAQKDTQLAMIHLSYIEMTHVGQAFRLGRYPVHFHLNGDMSKSSVKGLAIHHSFNRAVNIHGTNYVEVKDVVAYNIMGGAFFLEDGIEYGNIFDRVLAVFVKASSSLRNDDITPAAFWVTHPNNTVTNTAAAGGTHFGTWYRMHEHPEGPSKTDLIFPRKEPLGIYRNNVAHSLGWFGLWIFPIYNPSSPAVFEGLTVWNTDKGAEAVVAGNVRFENFKVANCRLAAVEFKRLSHVNRYNHLTGPGVFNSILAAYVDGMGAKQSGTGVSLPWEQGFQVNKTTFINFDQSPSSMLSVSTMDGVCGHLCGGFTYHTSQIIQVNSPRVYKFSWENEAVIKDVDGSLLGTSFAGYQVLPSSAILPSSKCTDVGAASVGISSSKCEPSVSFHRFSINNAKPVNLEAKDIIFVASGGSQLDSEFSFKRVTHPKGWMVLLPGKEKFDMKFANVEQLGNFSYHSAFHSFEAGDYVTICQKSDRVDHFDIGGAKIDVSTADADPATSVTGTWYYVTEESKLCYIVSGYKGGKRKKRAVLYDEDRSINLNAFKCYFTDCKPPPDPKKVLGRPDNFQLWSDPATWVDFGNGEKPTAGNSVEIPADMWIVIDEEIPVLDKLVIQGGLEVENNTGINFEIVANVIDIRGRLVIGWEGKPFFGRATVTLHGSHSDPAYPIDDGPPVGSKTLAVYGVLDLHGMDYGKTWVSMSSTASPGDQTIVLEEEVAWPVGSDILISTTSFNAWETETFKITARNGAQLMLNGTLHYRHDVASENLGDVSYKVSAKVGLLSRNIKIVGGDYENLYKESFGARILVASTTSNDGEDFHLGSAMIENVEFYHTGQEGWVSSFDPRFSLSFVNVGSASQASRRSYVRSSSFHNGFSTAIGVIGTDDLLVSDNVIHHTVRAGIITESTNTTLLRNLICLVICSGFYQDRRETVYIRWDAGVEAMAAKDVVLKNNVVAGSERAGYRVRGEKCSDTAKWSNNEAHGCLTGFAAFPEDPLADKQCTKYANIVSWRCYDFGVYISNAPSLEIVNYVSLDNGLGLFPMVIGPSAVNHATSDKYVLVRGSVFVGRTSTFDNTIHKIDTTDDNFKFSSQGRNFLHTSSTRTNAGMVMGQFTQGSNNPPRKPWRNVMSYNAISGKTDIEDSSFVNFGDTYDGKISTAISTNKNNDDYQHGTFISNVRFINVKKNSRYHNHIPNVGKINPADCVDMDCDGLKKVIIKDKDGSLLGSPGTIVSRSEFQWDGEDRRHGLGDFRIPKVMLTTLDGERMDINDIAPNKGIVRNDDCEFIPAWNAHECHNIDHVTLVVESLDEDTETRRISPVAVLINQYVDLANGPQDHGWCFGYTCNKRLSTFHLVVETSKPADIYFTSTSPQKLRLQLLNVDSTQKVRAAVYYGHSYRQDVFMDGVYQLPRNGEMVNGRFKYKAGMKNTECLPSPVSGTAGENCIMHDEGMVSVLVAGTSQYEIRESPQVIVGLTFTDDFFNEEDLVANLVTFLKVDPSQIRIVSIVRATSSRRKRQTPTVVITVECGDEPSTPAANQMTYVQLSQAATDISNGATTGTLTVGPGGAVPIQVVLTEAKPPVASEEWAHVEADTKPFTLSKAGKMTFHQAAVPGAEGQPFLIPIRLRVYNEQGAPLEMVGTSANPWKVGVTLVKGNGSHTDAVLGGTTTMNFTKGWANFTDLYISHPGENYVLEFNVTDPDSNFTEVTPPLSITKRGLFLHHADQDVDRYEDQPMEVTLQLKDNNTHLPVSDIAWRGHTWNITAHASDFNITGTMTVAIDPVTSVANFTNIQVDEVGEYMIDFRVMSEPPDYDFLQSVRIRVTNTILKGLVREKVSQCQVKVDANYHVIQSPKDVIRMGRKWAALYKNKGVEIKNTTAVPGSVLATFFVEGTTTGVESLISDVCKETEERQTYTFNGQSAVLMSYLRLDGKDAYGVSCGLKPVPPHKGLHPGIIAAIVLGVLLVLTVVIVLIVWRCVIVPKNKTYDISKELRSMNKGDTKYTIEDYLFRDKTTETMRREAPSPHAPADTSGATFSLSLQSRLDMYDDRPVSAGSAKSLPPKMPLPSD